MTISLLPDDPYDQSLRQLVGPADWVNPQPLPRYQLVVIGGGPAGLVCAAAAAGLGATVALVERDLLGGDCLNVGCVPSKTLLRAARAAAEVRRAHQFGVKVQESVVDFPAVVERVRQVRARLAGHDSAERFRSLGVHVFLGRGRFAGPDVVDMDGTRLRFGRCVIAAGARPVVPEISGLSSTRWFTNESIFTLTELPKRLLVVGGGPVGCELAQAFARLGSQATLSTPEARILPREDRDAVERVESAMRTDGVSITSEAGPVTGYDAVIVAAGRKPNVESLDLPAAGVEFDAQQGVRVDDFLRTTNPRIFAAGDVAAVGYRFTHAADAMARLVIRNALFPGKSRMSTLAIPWCTYTDPELGRVGLSEAEAAEQELDATIFQHEWPLDRAATDDAPHWVKVLVRKGSDRILGATVVGHHAGELVGTLSMAMTAGIGLGQIAATVFPYPTYTEALKKVADQYNRTRLTSRARRLLGAWLRWFR